MKRNLQIEEQVDAAMRSLDGLQPAEANPYLFTRIQQRMQNKRQLNSFSHLMLKLAVALILFIGVNVFTYERITGSSNTSNTGIEAFATDYDLQLTADNI
jgi:hypothetical protein